MKQYLFIFNLLLMAYSPFLSASLKVDDHYDLEEITGRTAKNCDEIFSYLSGNITEDTLPAELKSIYSGLPQTNEARAQFLEKLNNLEEQYGSPITSLTHTLSGYLQGKYSDSNSASLPSLNINDHTKTLAETIRPAFAILRLLLGDIEGHKDVLTIFAQKEFKDPQEIKSIHIYFQHAQKYFSTSSRMYGGYWDIIKKYAAFSSHSLSGQVFNTIMNQAHHIQNTYYDGLINEMKPRIEACYHGNLKKLSTDEFTFVLHEEDRTLLDRFVESKGSFEQAYPYFLMEKISNYGQDGYFGNWHVNKVRARELGQRDFEQVRDILNHYAEQVANRFIEESARNQFIQETLNNNDLYRWIIDALNEPAHWAWHEGSVLCDNDQKETCTTCQWMVENQ